ncbi:MAG: hypothetical protein ACI837_003239 [Crocinitomicaceae bacterium]|jgi:hypothetical protein
MKRGTILLLATVFILLVAFGFTFFLHFHETRADALNWKFDDPVFKLLPIADVSIAIFSITYGAMFIYALSNFRIPHFLSRAFLGYGILLIFRTGTLALVPLKEPDTIVFLDDPFLNYFIYTGENNADLINADLFFSGHTALLFLLFFLTKKKLLYLVLGIILAILLMIQRVHYSIDILGAIPFAYLSVRFADYILFSLAKRT